MGGQPQSPLFTVTYQLRLAQICGKIPQAWSAVGGHNVVGTHPYAHPQHIKVVKHILYIFNSDSDVR